MAVTGQYHLGSLTALPHTLLELVLISRTSTQDKKALRLVCKVFQQVLEGGLVFIRVYLDCWSKFTGQPCFDRLMHRLQHACGLRTMELVACKEIGVGITHLPTSLTTLKIYGGYCDSKLDLTEIGKLPHLASLTLGGIEPVIGMEHVSRLTHLHCDTFIGSVAHLAASLQHLRIQEYKHVQGMEQLTRLKTLEVKRYMPANFFQVHGRLPLEQLAFSTCHTCEGFMENKDAWQSAPPTLVHLAVTNVYYHVLPWVLPVSITHLQLLCGNQNSIKHAATALPGLKRLDLEMRTSIWYHAVDAFTHLSKLLRLQSLGICMCMYLDHPCPLQREQILSAIPEVSRAVSSGLNLNVVERSDELVSVFQDPWRQSKNVKSSCA